MRSYLLVAAILLAATIQIPTATASVNTLLVSPDGSIPQGAADMIRVGAGCVALPRFNCVDDYPPGTHDSDGTHLTVDGTQEEWQADYTLNWSLDPEDSIIMIRLHAFVSGRLTWPVGTYLNVLVQENAAPGTICLFEELLGLPLGTSYALHSYPLSDYDASCSNSAVNEWEVLFVFHCAPPGIPTGCASAPVLKLTAVYLEILYTDRLGFAVSGDNFAWLIFAVLITGGILGAVYTYARWRDGRL